MVESTIHGISVCPDCPLLWLTSFSSPGEVEMRTSAPAGSFVSHEITTQPCPKEMGFGLALIFPVIAPVRSVLLTSKNQDQLLAAIAISGCSTAADGAKLLRWSSLNKNSSYLRAASV